MLNKANVANVGLKEIFAKKLHEMTPAIAVTLGRDLDHAGNMTFFEDHRRRLPFFSHALWQALVPHMPDPQELTRNSVYYKKVHQSRKESVTFGNP